MSLGPERWGEVQRIFDLVVDRPDSERDPLLSSHCEGDAALRGEVESLLEAYGRPDPRIAATAAGSEDLSGRTIGSYRLLEPMAGGGMGSVYLARRVDREFEHKVAIKLLPAGPSSPDLLRRFHRERQILAALDHPNIARLFDGGTTEAEAIPYFVMEHIDGLPIDLYCDERRLGWRARLGLFGKVCDAVAFAHRKLVVHRDIKPGNILVTRDGIPKLLDFGIAKLLASTREPTEEGAPRPLTPSYASPEQLRGEEVTTATDVYSLGVLLHKLSTGQLPKRRSELPPALPGDLRAILERALATRASERYTSAEQLAEDVRRVLEHRPVSARPHTWTYIAGRWVRRHRLGAAAIVGSLLFAALLVTQVIRQRDQARGDRDRAEQVATMMLELFEAGGVDGEISARDLLRRGGARLARELSLEPRLQADFHHALGAAYRRFGLYEEAEPLLESALVTRRRLLTGEHPEVAESLYQLSMLATKKGEYGRAETLQREALAIWESTLDPATPEIIESRYHLARLLSLQGDLRRAELLYRQGIAKSHELTATHRHLVADGLQGLGVLLHEKGDDRESEKLLRQAVALYLSAAGRKGNAAVALKDLGNSLRNKGELAEAEALIRQALALEREVFGEEHPNIAGTLGMLGSLRQSRGELEGAKELFQEALAMRRRLQGGDHIRVATLLSRLARIHAAQGEPAVAESMLREAVRIGRRVFPEGSPQLAYPLLGLGELLLGMGQGEEALEPLSEALALRRQYLPAESPLVAEAALALARCLLELGSLDEAEALLLETRRASGAAGGPASQRIAALLGSLAEARHRAPPRRLAAAQGI